MHGIGHTPSSFKNSNKCENVNTKRRSRAVCCTSSRSLRGASSGRMRPAVGSLPSSESEIDVTWYECVLWYPREVIRRRRRLTLTFDLQIYFLTFPGTPARRLWFPDPWSAALHNHAICASSLHAVSQTIF